MDATTAARVRVNHGADPPGPEEVTALTADLRALAEGVRTAGTPAQLRPPSAPAGDEASVLAPVRQEVAAARGIASEH